MSHTPTHRTDTHAADLASIEKLHQQDIEFTLSQDPKGLIDTRPSTGCLFSWHQSCYFLSPSSQASSIDTPLGSIEVNAIPIPPLFRASATVP